jgi:hypothetical protein
MSQENTISMSASTPKNTLGMKTKVHLENLARGSFYTTRSLVECCVREHLEKLERKSAWTAPAGVALTMALTLATAEFMETFGLTTDTLKAIAITALVISLFLMFKNLRYALMSYSIQDLVRDIQKAAESESEGTDQVSSLKSSSSI